MILYLEASNAMTLKAHALLRYLICGILFPLMTHGQSLHNSVLFDHLTVDDGLSHTTVHTVLEDHFGMIWMGTRFGLNRFDGYEFKVYLHDENDSSSINGYAIYCLWEDAYGNIWAGHQDAGISIFERKTGRFIAAPFVNDSSMSWGTISVRTIFQDSRSNIWIGTFGGGAVAFDQNWNRLGHFCTYCDSATRKLSNDFVFDFEEDPQGRIWIGTAGNGINIYDPIQDQSAELFRSKTEAVSGFGKSFCLDKNGNMWVGNAGNGLYSIDLATLEIGPSFRRGQGAQQGLSNDIITDLELDPKGQIWIATDGGGLNRFSPQSNQWAHFGYHPDYLSSINTDALYDLMWDHSGNLWIGTFNGGVNLKKNEQPLFATNRRYAEERTQGLRSVICLDQDTKGALWFGTDGGGLFHLSVDQSPIQFIPLSPALKKNLPDKVITSLISTSEGNLWLGTFAQGLRYVNTTSGEVLTFQYEPDNPQSLSHNNVWDIELMNDGSLWVGTLGGGLNYLTPNTTTFKRFVSEPRRSNALSGVQVIDIMLDRKEQYLWIATENAGLNRLNLATHNIIQYHYQRTDSNSLSSDHLRCLFEDDKGLIWIGTEHAGLNVLDPKTNRFEHFDTQDGLPSNMINSIVQSDQGDLWVSTQVGIVSMDMKQNRFIDIGSEPYLTNNQYNPGAALKLEDGRLVFGSTNGYSLLLPDQLRRNVKPPNVVFTDLSISGESIPVGEFEGRTILTNSLNDSQCIIHLSYRDKGVNIKFASTDYSQAGNIQYAYRLTNFDSKWNYLSAEQRFASFSSLPGGTYTLEVKAANRDGVWSKSPNTLTVIVTPPFWETWWFVLICMLVGVCLILGIMKFILNRQNIKFRQQKLHAEREILHLKNENLEKDIAGQQAKLSASVLQIAHKNKILNDLKGQLQDVHVASEKNAKGLAPIIHKINSELKEENYWEQFQLIFNQTHTHFVERLQQLHPKLSTHEKRLCCFLRMQLSNREIASILNITINAVEQAKYRMKKKLDLSKEEPLQGYIQKIDSE
ncbi:MAG: two-component regulator propeller domain-containing protein [Bacteroidia bacterium]